MDVSRHKESAVDIESEHPHLENHLHTYDHDDHTDHQSHDHDHEHEHGEHYHSYDHVVVHTHFLDNLCHATSLNSCSAVCQLKFIGPKELCGFWNQRVR